jgi:3-phenylpropionate/trans-cinnamate dioxygenase ferredoxin reductase subunit
MTSTWCSGDPTVVAGPDAAAPEFLAFWVRGGAVLAGMNANVWDVTETVGDLVKAGLAGRTVDLAALADPEIPLTDLLG